MAPRKEEPSAIARAKQHFVDHAPKPFDVPEWGIKIFPVNESMADRAKRHAFNKKKDFDQASSFAYAVILLARKEDGTPHFVSGDRRALVSDVDPDVLERVSLGCLGKTVEDAEKN